MSNTARQPQLDLKLPRLGALERWREEIRAGLRKNDFKHFDDLAAAACSEMAAREAAADGDWDRAYRFLDRTRLRLAGYRGDPDSKEARELLKRLKAENKTEEEPPSLPADWKATPDPRGWR